MVHVSLDEPLRFNVLKKVLNKSVEKIASESRCERQCAKINEYVRTLCGHTGVIV